MPKLKNRMPKLCKNGDYAFTRFQGKKISLGRWGSDEAKQAYARFITELQNNPLPNLAIARSSAKFSAPLNQEGLISELTVLYLRHIKANNIQQSDYSLCETILEDFLLPLYADFPANSFSPKCLKAVRSNMVASGRYCREGINKQIRRIIAMFSFGVEEELCDVQTVAALREVKPLRKGAVGTYDHPPRKPVPEEVIKRTLPFLTPLLQAMVQIQWLLGLRPTEVCKMKVGDIDRKSDPDGWVYNLFAHKTSENIGERKIYLAAPVQKLLEPYLKGKKAGQFVFSPAESERERHQRQRTERKSPHTPSQTARDEHRAINPGITFSESYNKDSYRGAIQYAIKRANKILPSDKQIPHWYPYQIRHATATFIEEKEGLDESQAVLGHTSADMTRRYAKAQQAIQKRVALEQKNPFEEALTDEAA